MKGQTASSSYKPAKLDNGERVLVPPHIEAGTRIVVTTSRRHLPGTCEGLSRAGWQHGRPSAMINVDGPRRRKSGAGLIRDFGEVEHLQVSRKGPADFVSTADTRPEQTLKAELQKARPDFGFLLEEGGSFAGKDASTAGSSTRWTAPPTSCTACRSGQSRSRWKRKGRLSPASSMIRYGTRCSGPRRAPAPGTTTSACASPAAASWTSR